MACPSFQAGAGNNCQDYQANVAGKLEPALVASRISLSYHYNRL